MWDKISIKKKPESGILYGFPSSAIEIMAPHLYFLFTIIGVRITNSAIYLSYRQRRN